MFQYKCVKCGDLIDDKKGGIGVNTQQAADRQTEQAEETVSGPKFLSLAQIVEQQASQVPEATWRPFHEDCQDASVDYVIEVQRLRTFEQFASWTAHLWEKEWFAYTDWNTFTRTYLKPRDV